MNLLGHRIHPMLIPFPIGLLTTGVAFDIVYLITDDDVFARVSYWMIAAGVIGALLAALFGLVDFTRIPSGTRAKSIGITHAVLNVVVTSLFGASWLVRYADVPEEPSMLAIALGWGGLAVMLVSGWLGGELVYRLGIGVHENANADAPNSLTGEPAGRARSPERSQAPIRGGSGD